MDDFNLMNDEEIIKTLAKRFEQVRIKNELSEVDVCKQGGTNKDAIHRFKNGKNINLKNFIAMLRGVGLLEELSNVFVSQTEYSPKPQVQKKPKKRVFKKNKDVNINDEFKWGDES